MTFRVSLWCIMKILKCPMNIVIMYTHFDKWNDLICFDLIDQHDLITILYIIINMDLRTISSIYITNLYIIYKCNKHVLGLQSEVLSSLRVLLLLWNLYKQSLYVFSTCIPCFDREVQYKRAILLIYLLNIYTIDVLPTIHSEETLLMTLEAIMRSQNTSLCLNWNVKTLIRDWDAKKVDALTFIKYYTRTHIYRH